MRHKLASVDTQKLSPALKMKHRMLTRKLSKDPLSSEPGDLTASISWPHYLAGATIILAMFAVPGGMMWFDSKRSKATPSCTTAATGGRRLGSTEPREEVNSFAQRRYVPKATAP